VVGADVQPMLDTALGGEGPAAFRFPRGTLPPPSEGFVASTAPVVGARWLHRPDGARGCFITLGPLGLEAVAAARQLSVPTAVLDARVLAPLDVAAVTDACRLEAVVTVEEGTVHGGLGSAVLEVAAAAGLSPRLRTVGLPDAFVRHGDARAQRVALGLDATGFGRDMLQLLGG
jgi:1-deoxy-D-xylulose-5-phosphate synthase